MANVLIATDLVAYRLLGRSLKRFVSRAGRFWLVSSVAF